MYKNNIYLAFITTKDEWMMVVYNPKDDAWSNFGLSIKKTNYVKNGAKLIIEDDCLFFAHVCCDYYFANRTIITINEMKIEDRLLIPITKITWLEEMKDIE